MFLNKATGTKVIYCKKLPISPDGSEYKSYKIVGCWVEALNNNKDQLVKTITVGISKK